MAQATELILALVVATSTQGTELVKDPVCRDPARAPYICDQVVRMFDESLELERSFDKCMERERSCEKKLEIRPVAKVQVEEKEVVPDWLWIGGGVVGVVALVGGILLGAQF